MRRTILALLLSTSALAGLAACTRSQSANPGGSAGGANEPVRGGTLVYGLTGESSGWMPQKDRWGPGPITVARAIFDPLVIIGTDGEMHPWLAESFTPQDKNKTWLIKIRPGIQFHNGEPVDSHAVVYNLIAFQKSALSVFAYKPVRNIEKVDDLTVKVTLDQEWANFPAVFTGQAGFIIAPEQLRNDDSRKPIGSGPFMYREWIPDSKFQVIRNPNYWRKDAKGQPLPYLDDVTFRPLIEEGARFAALSAGDIDVMHSNSPTRVSKVLQGTENTFVTLVDASEGDELNAVLNTQQAPTNDLRVRKALQLSTDRKAIVATFNNAFDIADGPFSNKNKWWSDSGWPEPNIDEAKRLLGDYQKDHPGTVKITITTLATSDGLQAAQILKDQWTDAGFDATIESQEETKFSQTLIGGAFQALLFQFWNGEDPDVNYHFWTGTAVSPEGAIGLNFPRFTNDQIDQGLNQGRAETDAQKRRDDYAQVWRQWAEQVPYLWLFHAKWIVLTQPNVHGIDDVNMPDGTGKAQPIIWGTTTLSNTWKASG